jgi:hypothetical protein
MIMMQMELAQGTRRLITWFPYDPKIRVGATITLKNGIGGTWGVNKLYSKMDSTQIQRGWGLDLPKSARTER